MKACRQLVTMLLSISNFPWHFAESIWSSFPLSIAPTPPTPTPHPPLLFTPSTPPPPPSPRLSIWPICISRYRPDLIGRHIYEPGLLIAVGQLERWCNGTRMCELETLKGNIMRNKIYCSLERSPVIPLHQVWSKLVETLASLKIYIVLPSQ